MRSQATAAVSGKMRVVVFAEVLRARTNRYNMSAPPIERQV